MALSEHDAASSFQLSAARLAWWVVQVMRLGSPVTAVTLSPRMDLLATAHVGQRGIFLWSNQRMFGAGAEASPSARFCFNA